MKPKKLTRCVALNCLVVETCTEISVNCHEILFIFSSSSLFSKVISVNSKLLRFCLVSSCLECSVLFDFESIMEPLFSLFSL